MPLRCRSQTMDEMKDVVLFFAVFGVMLFLIVFLS